jgi:hypothetical protein
MRRIIIGAIITIPMIVGCERENMTAVRTPSPAGRLIATGVVQSNVALPGLSPRATRQPPVSDPIAVRKERLTVAIAPPHKLNGAVMILVRDTSAKFGEMIIFARDQMNDPTVRIGEDFMAMDKAHVPIPATRRVISVFANQGWQLTTAGKVTHGWARFRMASADDSTRANALTGRLRGREAKGQEFDVAEIGKVRIVFDPASR